MAVESTQAEDLRMDAGALWAALRSRALRIVVVSVLLVVATFVVLLFVPKMYESVASLLVEDRTSSFTDPASAPTPTGSGVSIDALLSSQIELIRSRDTLLAVVDTLNLRSVPEFNGSAGSPLTTLLTLVGRKPEPRSVDETVLQNLNDRLTVIRERDSAVVSIYVRSSDPDLAGKIANALADETVKRRAGQSVADTQEATAWLQQQIDTLRTKVQDADSKVADFKAKNGIFAGSNGTTLPDQQISDIGKQITDAQELKGQAQQRADLIRSLLKSGQPLDGVDDIRNSAVIAALLQNRATLQTQLAEKLATLLPAHPTIIALKAQIAQLTAQINTEARHIADGLDAQVTVQDGLIQSLDSDLDRAKLASSTQTKDGVTLDSLTREAKAQSDLLDAYLLKYRDASGRTDTGSVLPDVRVITRAAPSVVPASPKTALILGAVGFVSLALQVGTVLFGELMSGRAVYDRNLQPLPVELPQEPVFAEETAEREENDTAAPEPDLADLPEIELGGLGEPPSHVDPGEAQPVPAEMLLTPEARHRAIAAADLTLSNLTADLALGRVHVVLLAAVSEGRDAAIVADTLVSEAMRKGLSVCRVDAGSGRASNSPGLTDLCADEATYGDIVHKVRDGLAEVPWGQRETMDRRSMKPLTLVEALADIYEVVVISTGRVGLNSSLPLFAGTGARLVIVRQPATPATVVAMATTDAAALGFDVIDSVAASERQYEVA